MNFLEMCEMGDLEEVSKMVEDGVTTRDVDEDVNTALHLSVDQLNHDVSKFLQLSTEFASCISQVSGFCSACAVGGHKDG